MASATQVLPPAVETTTNSEVIQTTLYDLIAAISEEVEDGEEPLVTAIVTHLLRTHRVTCHGDLQGFQFAPYVSAEAN